MSNKIIKSVGFNKTNSEDIKMLKHVEGRNFSGYVKELIQADIKATEKKRAENKPIKAVGGEIKFKF